MDVSTTTRGECVIINIPHTLHNYYHMKLLSSISMYYYRNNEVWVPVVSNIRGR